MYLYKKTYVKNWEHNGAESQHTITVKLGGEVRKDIKPERIAYITEEVAYWRKFNALHGWFVNECGDGEDKCQEIYVDRGKMGELLNILNQVQNLLNNSKLSVKELRDWNGKDYEVEVYECEDEVKELFCPTEGFFFGSTEVDKYFKQDVEETIETIDGLLKETENEDAVKGLYSGDFYYRASW